MTKSHDYPVPLAAGKNLLEPLWYLAQAACEDIEEFRPDLVMALAHSGWLPLRAAQVLWEETHRERFPPWLLTNLGREKDGDFADIMEQLELHLLQGIYSSVEVVVGFLVWIHEQRHWHEMLRRQVAMALGCDEAPERILVVDDFAYEGNTWILTLGLLWMVYPQAETRFVSSCPPLPKTELGMLWLQQHHPDLVQPLLARFEAEKRESRAQSVHEVLLRQVMCGTEDVAADSLEWRAISPSSKSVQALSAFLPVEEWMTVPSWVQTCVESYVRELAHLPSDTWPPRGAGTIQRHVKADVYRLIHRDK